jgi:YHS domain-containing protein
VRKEIIMKVKDPVCGMEIDSEKAFAKREHEGRTFYFDSQDCVDKFDADPHKYGVTRRSTSTTRETTCKAKLCVLSSPAAQEMMFIPDLRRDKRCYLIAKQE